MKFYCVFFDNHKRRIRMDFEGSWKITQKWHGIPSYSFEMKISKSGVITIPGGFTGTLLTLGSSNQMSMAIANFNGQSITSYVGNIIGTSMGGEALGLGSNGTVTQGDWSAQKSEDSVIPEKAHSVPS